MFSFKISVVTVILFFYYKPHTSLETNKQTNKKSPKNPTSPKAPNKTQEAELSIFQGVVTIGFFSWLSHLLTAMLSVKWKKFNSAEEWTVQHKLISIQFI